MYLEQIKTGCRVQIQKPSDGPAGGHMCKVEVFFPKTGEALIHAPLERGRYVLLPKDQDYMLRLLTSNAIYRYKARLIAFDDVDGFEVVRFKLMDGGEKVQRRSAFRFACALPITYSVIYTSGQQSERENGLIADLSAGGAKIYTVKNLHTGYLLNIGLELDRELVVAFGDIRSKSELPRGGEYAFQYGVHFAMMPESDQEMIIRYMYKLQRSNLKRAYTFQ